LFVAVTVTVDVAEVPGETAVVELAESVNVPPELAPVTVTVAVPVAAA
jgi:hypothetical protein